MLWLQLFIVLQRQECFEWIGIEKTSPNNVYSIPAEIGDQRYNAIVL
jgi:hypothetical protein